MYNIYGGIFTITACLGLVTGVFEAAFKIINYTQFPIRMFLHLISIPIGVYLRSLNELAETSGVKEQTILLLSFCAITVGSVGIIIGTLELATIPVRNELFTRMVIYATCLVAGMSISPFEPQKKVVKPK